MIEALLKALTEKNYDLAKQILEENEFDSQQIKQAIEPQLLLSLVNIHSELAVLLIQNGAEINESIMLPETQVVFPISNTGIIGESPVNLGGGDSTSSAARISRGAVSAIGNAGDNLAIGAVSAIGNAGDNLAIGAVSAIGNAGDNLAINLMGTFSNVITFPNANANVINNTASPINLNLDVGAIVSITIMPGANVTFIKSLSTPVTDIEQPKTSIMQEAINSGNIPVAKALLNRSDFALNQNHENILKYAVNKKQFEIASEILNYEKFLFSAFTGDVTNSLIDADSGFILKFFSKQAAVKKILNFFNAEGLISLIEKHKIVLSEIDIDWDQCKYHWKPIVQIGIQHIKPLMKLEKSNGERFFNINFKDSQGIRLIDNVTDHNTINLLRELGSFEPKNPIGSIQKVDISNGRLDGYEPNKIAAVKLLELLSKKYQLNSEQMDNIINTYKLKDFGGWVNESFSNKRVISTEGVKIICPYMSGLGQVKNLGEFLSLLNREFVNYGLDNLLFNNSMLSVQDIIDILQALNPQLDILISLHELTVPEVIDELSKLGNVYDRLPVGWNFKNVIAGIICAIEGDEQKEQELVSCLTQLTACNLGKLINLLHVCQDRIIGTDLVDYSKMQLTEFELLCADIMNMIKEDNFCSKALAKWVYDIQTHGINKLVDGEGISGHSVKIVSIMNKAFMKHFGKGEFLESYHFNDGLQGALMKPLAERLYVNKGDTDAFLFEFYKLFNEGLDMLCFEFLDKSISKKLIISDDITYSSDSFFGEFSNLSCNSIDLLYKKALSQHGKDYANSFIKLLKEHCTLNSDVESLIDKTLDEITIFVIREHASNNNNDDVLDFTNILQNNVEDENTDVTISGDSTIV